MDASQFSVSGFLLRVRNSVLAFCRRLLLWILSAGPIPQHIAVIMDGNRRFADRRGIDRTAGHVYGYESLMRVLKDCFDLRVKFVTVYAFSIDNFQRPSEEVSALMELMQSKLEALTEKEGLAREHGVRVNVLGDLSLLPEGVRNAAERAMAVTRSNNSAVLNLCISYTSTQEIVHSVQSVRNNFVYKLGKDNEGADSQSDRERLQNGVMERSLDVASTGLRKRLFHAKQVSSDLSAVTGSEVEDINFKFEARKENFPINAKKKDHPFPFPETLNSPIDIAPRKNFLKYRIIEGDDVGTNASSSNRLLKMGEHIRMESVVCSQDDNVSSEQRAGENLFDRRQDAVSAIAEGRAGFKGQPATNTTEVNGFRARDYQGSSLHENGFPNNCACGHHDDSADELPQFLIDRITENEIQQHLYTDSCPPPDIVLRTSGETRLSNFLLWQSSFSHLAFCKVLWPDFSFRHLFSVIFEYQRAYSDLSRKRHLCNQIMCQSHELSCSSVWAS